MEGLKLFVGGYFDDRIFEGDFFIGKTPFNKDVDVYSLKEVQKLGFVGDEIKEYFEERNDKEWEETTDEEKVKAIIDYTEFDEIARLAHFNTEEEALNYKNEILKEIEDSERCSEYVETKQCLDGYYREIYKYKND